jgi:methylenetetrahydrofolate reductase (NADPH)
MKIIEKLNSKKTISFEVFPPNKETDSLQDIYKTIDELSSLNPDFISVTFGSGGNTKGKTIEVASYIKNSLGIESVAHLTCITNTKNEISDFLNILDNNNIDNVLALRGDYPKDFDVDNSKRDFMYSSDLTEYISDNFKNRFCISGACYPEVHQEADCFQKDLESLKEKVEAGAEYLITQVFFDNNYYYKLVQEARRIGINVPIIAGIMPILSSKQILKMTRMCGCTIPYSLSNMIQKYYNEPEIVKEIGTNYAISQIIDLVTNGVDGIHIYTMNKSDIAKKIFSAIPNVIEKLRETK